MTFLRNLLTMSVTVVLSELAFLGLAENEIGIIVQDFQRAKQHLWFTLVMKHSFWSHEPWVFFGLAHRDERVAQAIARKCLKIKPRILWEPVKAIHYLTNLLLFTPELLSDLTRFANGQSLDTLPRLAIVCAMLRFAYTLNIFFTCLNLSPTHPFFSNDPSSMSPPFTICVSNIL